MLFWTSKWRVVIGIALLALTPLVAFDEGQRYWRLISDGAAAPAVVTKVERRAIRFTHYYANYEFTDPTGRRRTGRQEISQDLYEVLAAGKPNQEIVVHFWRPDPAVNVISLSTVRSEFLFFGAFALIAMVMIFSVFIAERKENSGIIAAVRRRIQIDNSRRASPRSGPSGER